jgi:hypothetical protein
MKMNIESTKTNAAAIPTGQSNRRPSRARTLGLFDVPVAFKRAKSSRLKVQGSRELPSSELKGSNAPVFLRFFDPGGLRFGTCFELCSLSFELRRADIHWTVEEGTLATRSMHNAVQLGRAPAFAPLHRFINCLMAEASDRTE